MVRRNVRYFGLAASLTFVAAPPAWADMYKCVQAHAPTYYTNNKDEIKGKNCTVVTREISVIPAGPRTPPARAAKANPSPPGFPKVDPATQKSRDNARRRILEEELSGEQKALAKAKEELAQQESVRSGNERNYQRVLDRLQPYKDDVARHEKNITALKKELDNVK